LLLVLGLGAAVYPKLSFPAVFFCIVGLIVSGWGSARAAARALLLSAIGLSVLGLFRFVTEEAIPGVLSGGKAAIEKQAVGYCRTLVSAQDHARAGAYLDPDGDGIGSALGFEELSGLAGLPGGTPIESPPLALKSEHLRETARGPAVRQAGYLVALCLPSPDGGFTRDVARRDPERAEREYRIYAWPETLGAGSPRTAFFADANEAILELAVPSALPRYVGSTRPPPCDAVVRDGDWTPWKGKKPRDRLPADPAARGSTP
jgi:hypothetical protein